MLFRSICQGQPGFAPHLFPNIIHAADHCLLYTSILEEIRKLPSGASMDQLKDRWYRGPDGSDYHYHQSRYHAFYVQKKVMLRIF